MTSERTTVIDTSPDADLQPVFKRNTLELIQQLKDAGQPIVLAICGKVELVVQDDNSFEQLLEVIDRVETIEAIRQGMKEIEEGKGVTLEEFREHVRQKHGISI